MIVDERSATLPTFTQVSAGQTQPVVVKATNSCGVHPNTGQPAIVHAAIECGVSNLC